MKRAKESDGLWDSQIRPQLEQRAAYHSQGLDLDVELDNRIREAYRLLPHPDEVDLVESESEGDAEAMDTEAVRRFKVRLANVKIEGER